MKLKNISGQTLEIVDVPRVEPDGVVEVSKEMGERLLAQSNFFEKVERVKEVKKDKKKLINKE